VREGCGSRMGVERGSGVACGIIWQGGSTRSVWGKWGPWRGSGWSRRTVERIRVGLIGCPGRL
jgi:hypothetical protein